VDKTGRILVERSEMMEEMRNYFQELTEENTIVNEEKDHAYLTIVSILSFNPLV
jgi:hypothetical protein